MTTRQKIEHELRAAGEEGVGGLELRRRTGCNSGTFRRVIRSMIDSGEVATEVVPHPEWGTLKLHRWRGAQPIDGQTQLEDA